MTTAITKLQLSTVALAMGAAAAITPVVAQADSFAPLAPSLTSFAKSLGDTAGNAVCDVDSGVDCVALVTTAPEAIAYSAQAATASATSSGGYQSIFKNNLVWIGGSQSIPPAQSEAFWNNPNTVTVWTFAPLAAVPWVQKVSPKLWNWFYGIQNQSCFLGITTALGGPYSAPGTYTHSYNRQGCNPRT